MGGWCEVYPSFFGFFKLCKAPYIVPLFLKKSVNKANRISLVGPTRRESHAATLDIFRRPSTSQRLPMRVRPLASSEKLLTGE